MTRMEIKRIHTTVHLDPDVLHILNDMERNTGNNRSQLINDAVRGEYSWRPKVGEIFQEALRTHRMATIEMVFSKFSSFREEFVSDMKQELTNSHAEQNNLIRKSNRCMKRSNQL